MILFTLWFLNLAMAAALVVILFQKRRRKREEQWNKWPGSEVASEDREGPPPPQSRWGPGL